MNMLHVLLFVALVGLRLGAFVIKNIHSSDFEQKYTLNDKELGQTNLLIVDCKEQNLLSLMIVPQGGIEEELPRYPIFRPEQQQGMNRNHKTFLNNCRVDVEILNRSSIIAIKRKNSSKILFEIKSVTFNVGHHVIKTIDHSQIFGLGQRFQYHFDVKDGTWALWNRDRPWEIDTGSPFRASQTYGFHPLYLARQTHTKKFHITYFKTVHAMNVFKKQQKITYHVVDGNAHFLIFIGQEDPQNLLRQYHKFIGPSLIPPFWSMGYHQCRWGYKNIRQLQYVIKMHDKHKVPLDVVWNDLDYMYEKQDFTVDQDNFPLNEMKQNILSKVHYVPLLDAGVSIDQVQAYSIGNDLDVFMKLDNKNYLATVWPGLTSFVDFLHPNAGQYWSYMLDQLYSKIQFSGIWVDMNEVSNFNGNAWTNETYRVQHDELLTMMTADIQCSHFNNKNFLRPYRHAQVHNYYGHLMVEATNKFLMEKGLRPFIITRANAVGTGVYGGHWTGDNVASWEFLRLSISGNFLYQIFGMHMVGADICGFHLDTTQQLCSRWMQLGALYPFARNHNQEKYLGQQVYALGQQHLQTSRQSLNLRYSLLKQYYSVFVKSKGMGSIYSPLFFQFPNDQNCYETDFMQEQFMIGDFILCVPIVHEFQTQTLAYFPGGWYDFYDGDFKKGVQIVRNILPSPPSIYIRSGRLVFVNQAKTRTRNLDSNFSIKTGLKKSKSGYSSSGFILSINDYQDNSQLQRCIRDGCFYNIRVSTSDFSEIKVQWKYEGSQGLHHEIFISWIQIFSESRQRIQKQVSMILSGEQGQVIIEL